MNATDLAGFKPATHWNSAPNATGTLSSLLAADGSTTTASINWNAPATYTVPFTDASGDAHMMNGFLEAQNSVSATITIGVTLPSSMSGAYDVYVYCYGNIDASTRTYKLHDRLDDPFREPDGALSHYLPWTLAGARRRRRGRGHLRAVSERDRSDLHLDCESAHVDGHQCRPCAHRSTASRSCYRRDLRIPLQASHRESRSSADVPRTCTRRPSTLTRPSAMARNHGGIESVLLGQDAQA